LPFGCRRSICASSPSQAFHLRSYVVFLDMNNCNECSTVAIPPYMRGKPAPKPLLTGSGRLEVG